MHGIAVSKFPLKYCQFPGVSSRQPAYAYCDEGTSDDPGHLVRAAKVSQLPEVCTVSMYGGSSDFVFHTVLHTRSLNPVGVSCKSTGYSSSPCHTIVWPRTEESTKHPTGRAPFIVRNGGGRCCAFRTTSQMALDRTLCLGLHSRLSVVALQLAHALSYG